METCKSFIAYASSSCVITSSLIWAYTKYRNRRTVKLFWWGKNKNQVLNWLKSNWILEKNLLEQSVPFLPGSHKQIPVDVSQFPALLQSPGQINSKENMTIYFMTSCFIINRIISLPEQSCPWYSSSQVHSPDVKLHLPFPLQGVSPPGQDLSEIYEMFLIDSKLNKLTSLLLIHLYKCFLQNLHHNYKFL